MEEFWNGLGDARGYVVGAAVTFLGILVNVLALILLERLRSRVEERRQQRQWDREREERTLEVRRNAYAQVLATAYDFLIHSPFARKSFTSEHTAIFGAGLKVMAEAGLVCESAKTREALHGLHSAAFDFLTAARVQDEDGDGDSGQGAATAALHAARERFMHAAREELGLPDLSTDESAA